MTSAVNAQFIFEELPYRHNYQQTSPDVITSQQARHQMQMEKLSLQELVSEYFSLLLEEFERSVDSSKQRVQKLTNLLEQCQQHETGNMPEIYDPKQLQFWCRFQTTIDQYCKVQERLMNFPSSISRWQMDANRTLAS